MKMFNIALGLLTALSIPMIYSQEDIENLQELQKEAQKTVDVMDEAEKVLPEFIKDIKKSIDQEDVEAAYEKTKQAFPKLVKEIEADLRETIAKNSEELAEISEDEKEKAIKLEMVTSALSTSELAQKSKVGKVIKKIAKEIQEAKTVEEADKITERASEELSKVTEDLDDN